MRILRSALNRVITGLLRFVQRFLVYPRQLSFCGVGSAEQLCSHIARLGHKSVLLVTDKILIEIGLADRIIEALKNQNVEVVIYDGVLPDPTTAMVTVAVALSKQQGCDAVLALGGGSSIDTAKGVAAVLRNSKIQDLIGVLKVKNKPQALYAIPTTSGTGSEVSIAAVISDSDSHQKGVMGDPKLIPAAVALDASLLTGMPAAVTAATGFDALSHGIETYVGRWANDTVRQYSGAAVSQIFSCLLTAYKNGDDLAARESISLASYYAGVSLNDGSVGNVHALAHQIGSRYGIPHGVAISAVMPHVLKASFESIKQPLSELADRIGVADKNENVEANAQKFIDAVIDLQQQLNLPKVIDKVLIVDIPDLATAAIKESYVYPVPRFLSQSEAEAIIRKVASNIKSE